MGYNLVLEEYEIKLFIFLEESGKKIHDVAFGPHTSTEL